MNEGEVIQHIQCLYIHIVLFLLYAWSWINEGKGERGGDGENGDETA